MFKSVLRKLFEYQTLNHEEAREILINITKEAYNKSEVVAFLSVFMMRPVTVGELSGFRDALLELRNPVDLKGFDAIDMCGTGGDGKNTFNISTLSSFVVAGAGYKVAKHGNYGVSSGCGSSNVMESMGFKFTTDNDLLCRQLDKCGICFLHAPLFNPAMKVIAPIRRELGVKTFFNMLGPLINPANPANQLVGVYDLELARLYNYIFQESGKRFTILHSIDGYDEVSLTGAFKVIRHNGEGLMTPSDLGMEQLTPDQIEGGHTVEEAAKVFLDVLKGNGTKAQNDVVFANAALGIQCISGKSLSESVEMAKTSLLSGKALKVCKNLLELQ
jgi:anthranilate phosphoribosyltransferase